MRYDVNVRRTAPHPTVEYFLDAATHVCEIDAGTATALRLYDRDRDVMGVMERYRPIPTVHHGHVERGNRLAACLELGVLADEVITQLPLARHGGLVVLGLRHVASEVVSMAEVLAGWAQEDEIDGGCLLNFRKRPRRKDHVTHRRTARRIASPRFARRYVKNHDHEFAHLRALSDACVRRAQHASRIASDPTIMTDWRAQINYVRRREEGVGHRAERKMIKRSLRAATAVVDEDAVAAFLRGEEIKLIGEEAALVIKKRGALADRGHGCLSVGLMTRGGTRLADLCTYVNDTPTLDQLAAYALWIQAGELAAVVRDANIVTIEPAGRGHPLLARREADKLADLIRQVGPDRAKTIIEMINKPESRMRLTHEECQERRRAHWEATKGHWLEATLMAVIGRKNFAVYEAAGAL